jgi:hypothetical protein
MKILSEKQYKKIIQATEAERNTLDPLQPPTLASPAATIRRNNFKTINAQVDGIEQRYFAETDYGASLTRKIIEFRTAFIAGEGLNWNSEKKEVRDFIQKIMDETALDTIGLINIVRYGEMEGKLCIVPEVTRDKIKFNYLRCENNYKIEKDDKTGALTLIYKTADGKDKTLTEKQFVYIRLSEVSSDINISPPLIGTVLTQIDNAERALYDLRANNHYFGFATPHIEAQNWPDAKKILDRIKGVLWKIGRLIAGPFKFTFTEPSGRAVESLKNEIAMNLKFVSSTSSVPVHWLGWTDLMSNRATAEELEEMIATSTKIERIIYAVKSKELIKKTMVLARDAGYEGAVINDEFKTELPYVSLAYIKALTEVWEPLQAKDVVSMLTLRNKCPGINPASEQKQIDKEKKDKRKKIAKDMTELKFNPIDHDEEGRDEEES